jgi:hypothetical protein
MIIHNHPFEGIARPDDKVSEFLRGVDETVPCIVDFGVRGYICGEGLPGVRAEGRWWEVVGRVERVEILGVLKNASCELREGARLGHVEALPTRGARFVWWFRKIGLFNSLPTDSPTAIRAI